MSIFFNLIYEFTAILVKIPASYFVDVDKLILKFMWRDKTPRITNKILKEKNKIRGLTLSHLKTYYKATEIKTLWYWQKKRQIDHWNKIERPEIDPHKHSQLTFNKGAKAIQWRKDSLFNKWYWNNWISVCTK